VANAHAPTCPDIRTFRRIILASTAAFWAMVIVIQGIGNQIVTLTSI